MNSDFILPPYNHTWLAWDDIECTAQVGRGAELRVLLDPNKLLTGLQVRGMGMSDLAAAAGVSPPTVSSALAGRPVNLRTALALATALSTRPVLPEMAGLIATPTSPRGGAPSVTGPDPKTDQIRP